jgi:pimeloyl-ACP methyl ester carboxylesterase
VPLERECVAGGVRVRYRVAGYGPPAVLVHGLAGSWRWWAPVVRPLAARLRLHLLDLPGFGSARGRPFSLAEAPEHVRSVISAIGLERPHLVGHSLGGAVCARVAALWPGAVDRLVLAAPAGLLERRRIPSYALPLTVAAGRAGPRFLPTLVGDSLRAGPQTVFRAGVQLLRDEALRDELGSISAPTLLLWGGRDPVVPPALAARYTSAIPHARLVVLPGAGHVPMVERPDEFARAVLEFLSGPSPTAGP